MSEEYHSSLSSADSKDGREKKRLKLGQEDTLSILIAGHITLRPNVDENEDVDSYTEWQRYANIMRSGESQLKQLPSLRTAELAKNGLKRVRELWHSDDKQAQGVQAAAYIREVLGTMLIHLRKPRF